jgi:hypothetical protein
VLCTHFLTYFRSTQTTENAHMLRYICTVYTTCSLIILTHDDICNEFASPRISFSSGFKTKFSVPWNLINTTLYTVLTNVSFYVYCAGYHLVFLTTAVSKSLYHKCLFRHTMMSVTGLYNLHTLSSKGNSVTTCMSPINTHYTFLHFLKSFSCTFHAHVSLHSWSLGSGG